MSDSKEQGEVLHIVPFSGGKDSTATALWLNEHEPRDYIYVYNDTSAELPEVEACLRRAEQRFGKPIVRIVADLPEVIREQGMLPSPRARYCTRMVKTHALDDWIGKRRAVLYIGIRADEQRVGYQVTRPNITVRYPLQEAGLGLADVWRMIETYELPPLISVGRDLSDVCGNCSVTARRSLTQSRNCSKTKSLRGERARTVTSASINVLPNGRGFTMSTLICSPLHAS